MTVFQCLERATAQAVKLLLFIAVVSRVVAFHPVLAQNSAVTNLVGLPEHGVLLAGSVNSTTIVNNSTKTILGYTVRYETAAGHAINRTVLSFLAVRNGQSAGLRVGDRSVVPPSQTDVTVPGAVGPIVRVLLDAVIFDDGEVVGPDRTATLDRVTVRLKAEGDIHNKVLAIRGMKSAVEKDEAWAEIARASPGERETKPDTEMRTGAYTTIQKTYALELIRIRQGIGDDAAFELAGRSAKYPTIWRKQ